ncbi:WD repeat-containing protein 93 isoform X2 [Channa argus]|uniref:WD repeat-containing protein 93 isoform X2 n=1 Tax=Channa argus TaxID=215402 RepID=UPI0029483EAA|nr:hypothetical protein Q8A73_002030 [Channa argus]
MEASCKAEISTEETPSLKHSGMAQLPESTNCLACSEDGRYLSLGHSRGLSVWRVSSLMCMANWLQRRLEITFIQMTTMAEMVYLLGTVDDMGVARVFAYHCDSIHLLSVINIMEDINRRSICLTFELSERGHYGAASFICNGAVWLEVFHFPTDAWLKELKTAVSHHPNSPRDLDVTWSLLTVEAKIKPPKIPAALEGQLEVLQTADFLTHCLALDVDIDRHQWNECFNKDSEKTMETIVKSRCCTHHFLLPCSKFPGESKVLSQPELPVAVCVWWKGSHNLLHYLLQKTTKNKSNVEPIPDMLWPNAKEILCSAVSRCTRYIALGLDDGLVCVWDRQSGSPLSVVLVTATDSALFRIHFVDYWPVSTENCQTFASAVHVLVVCKSGTIHTVTIRRGTESYTVLVNESPKDSRDLPSMTAPVSFLQNLFLVVQRNGKMILKDVINDKTVCFLIPPKTLLISTPCKPVYALDTEQQTLFIRGDSDPDCSADSKKDRQSQLLIYDFRESEIIRQYIGLPHSPQQKTSFATLAETCNLYLQQRGLSVDERNKAIMETWMKLQEYAVTAQQNLTRAEVN